MEARERTADRNLLARWRDAVGRRDDLGPEPDWLAGDSFASVVEYRRLRGQLCLDASNAQLAIDKAFRELLEHRKLVAYGRRKALEAAPELISADILSALTQIDWERSAVGEPLGGTVFYAVRTYPSVLAPERTHLIAGRSLAEAFQMFVLEDPELVAIRSMSSDCNRDLSPEVGSTWSVTFDQADLPCHGPTESGEEIRILFHRFQALMGLLRSGELEGAGISADTGQFGVEPSLTWSDPNFGFHVTTGDLIKLRNHAADAKSDTMAVWRRSILLQEPIALQNPMSQGSAASISQRNRTRTGKRPGRKSQQFMDAVQEAEIDLATWTKGPKCLVAALNLPEASNQQQILAWRKLASRMLAIKKSRPEALPSSPVGRDI